MSHDLPPNPILNEAITLLRAGEPARAEEVVARAARQAKERFGPDSAAYAAAANDLGCVLLWTGQQRQALAAFRTACAVEFPGTGQEARDYLTRLMNLGTALEQAGDLAEAEEVLRRGLEGRRAFYGADHPGYAFGLEPLAQ